MTAGILLGALVFGLAQGGAIALLGAGIVTIHRGSGVLNLAQGAIAMAATYVAVGVAGGTGTHTARPLVLGVFAGVLAGAGLGVVIDAVAMRPLRGRSPIVRMTATLAILSILVSFAQLVWGASTTRAVPSLFGTGGHHLGSVVIGNDALGVAVTAFLLCAALGWFYQRTRLGTAIRAVADDPDTARLGGIRVAALSAVCWALGGAAAAIAGLLLSPSLGLNSFILTLLVVQGLAAALTGRLQHLLPTFLGGVGIGVLTALTRTWLEHLTAGGPPSWIDLTDVQDGIALAWMLAALLTWRRRPRGSEVQVPNGAEPRIRIDGTARAVGVLVGLAALAVIPPAAGAAGVYQLTVGGAYGIVVLSVVLVTGIAGQFSLAQASFMGVGAFAAAHLMAQAHLPFWVALPLGGLAAVPFGALTGVLTLRAHGAVTAVLTLGIGSAITGLLLSAGDNGGGLGSMPLPRPQVLDNSVRYCWFVFAVLGVLIAAVCALRTRRSGRMLLAVRDSEAAARAVGVGVAGARITAFAAGAFIAGVGGVLYAGIDGVAVARSFGPFTSIALLAVGVVGGLGSTAGAVIGGLLEAGGSGFVSGLPLFGHLADPGDAAGIAMGVLLLVQIVAFPSGLSRPLLRLERALGERLRPAHHGAAAEAT